MSVKRICVIASGYPSEYSVCNEFIENLVNQFVDNGIECCVITTQSKLINLIRKEKNVPKKRYRKTPLGNSVEVYTPNAMSYSAKRIGKINTAKWTLYSAQVAVEKVFKELHKEKKFDVIYGHFIFFPALIASYLSKKYHVPAFFAYGENTTYTIDFLGSELTRKKLQNITGVVSVSTENKRVLQKYKIAKADDIEVFPNAINSKLFYKMDKAEARRKLGIDCDKFVVAFVGRFLDVKGPDRLSEAIDKITDYEIYSLFMGVGPLKPTCRNILFSGAVAHDNMSVYLSAADVFVLPTKAEGCCNAIIEAMACGLPIISSNLPFNDDILDDNNSIRIDPCDISQIMNAINTIYENKELRLKMSENALETANRLSIEKRARNIISFMEKKIDSRN